MKKFMIILASAFGALLVVLVILASMSTKPQAEKPRSAVSTMATAVPSAPYQGVSPTTKAPPPEPTETKAQWFEEGTYEVGSKSDPDAGTIKPGTYILTTSDHCYWERLKGFSGGFDEIIANGNLDASGGRATQARLTIKKSDKGLSLGGMCVLGQKGGLK